MNTLEERSITHSTFVIERSYPAAVDHLFSAFSQPSRKRRWFAEGGRTVVEQFEMDFRTGGSERIVYRFQEGTPFPGATYGSHSTYLDIVADCRIALAYSTIFGGRPISACLVTIEFQEDGPGARLVLTHQGAYFEGSDGPQMREDGWRLILERLPQELALAG